MTRPARFQMSSDPHWEVPPGGRYVGRPTRWGNPFPVGAVIDAGDDRFEHLPAGLFADDPRLVTDRATAVEAFRSWLDARPDLVAAARAELAGRPLGCWCPLDGGPCHAEVLIEVANP